MSKVSDIIGYAETQSLKRELNDLLSTNTDYNEVEDLLLSYGLEMDYFFDLI